MTKRLADFLRPPEQGLSEFCYTMRPWERRLLAAVLIVILLGVTAGCTPRHEPSPSPTPTATPVPPATLAPTPIPLPPCTPRPERKDCRAACALFWADYLDRAATGSGECHWHPILDNTLLIGQDIGMTPCTDPKCCKWVPTPADLAKVPRAVDRDCNLLQMPRRNVVHPADSGYLGLKCRVIPAVVCPSR